MSNEAHILWFDAISVRDVKLVGGKNASLGEMIAHLKNQGVRVPEGFATTASAYWDYIAANGIEGEAARRGLRRSPPARRHSRKSAPTSDAFS